MNDNTRTKQETDMSPLAEGIDFYFEDGLMVLTRHFLQKRGYCCGNGCRHCPYDHINVPKSE
ncbi:MAG: DUF5522 domain-containing protein [Blastocatellia bacterium]